MHVLTLSPVDAWFSMVEDYPSALFRRNSHYRGEILLACSALRRADLERYAGIYVEGLLPDPAEWVGRLFFLSSIYAKTELLEVTEYGADFLYRFNRIELLPEPIKTHIYPMWWNFDLKSRKIIQNYPLSEENIGFFYDLCKRIERDELPLEHKALFLLEADPRARNARRGILIRLNDRWQVVRLPNWRVTFGKRFGKQYVPELAQGQNYASGHWRET